MSLTRGMPIQRLSLEFIPSNVTSFDNIVKINIIRTPGIAGEIEFINLQKYVIDQTSSLFEDAEHYLNYMSDSIYMSNDIFMGGIDVHGYAKDRSSLYVRKARLDDFRYLLDYMINQDDIVMYNIGYRYKGAQYITPLTISYKPLESKPLSAIKERPCITLYNMRFRGPNESNKIDRTSKAVFCDMRRLDQLQTEIESDNISNVETVDTAYSTLYNITDAVRFYNQYVKSEA